MRSFAKTIKPMVRELGVVRSAGICGVSERTVKSWTAGDRVPSAAMRLGVAVLLGRETGD